MLGGGSDPSPSLGAPEPARPPALPPQDSRPRTQDPGAGAQPASPDILGSPTRRMWGQCWSVLIKKGFVTPRTTLGLERGEREQAVAAQLTAGGGGAERTHTYGACVRVVNSLNSLSWMVK